MKKLITALLQAGLLAGVFAAGSAFALDIELSGEIKTGLFIENRELNGKTESYSRIYNNDGDSGQDVGRIRVGLNLQSELFGLRTRFYQQEFKRKTSVNDPNAKRVSVDFSYAYVNMLDSQLKVSAGLLGESPWATGGPELFREVEYTGSGSPIMGIRTEWKPNFSFLRGLNLGFVLNKQDDTMPSDAKEQFGDLFLESILGIAYEHDYFAFRFAYRFDRGIDSPAAIVNGDRFVYRAEERILGKLLPGMAIWANGYCEGINAAGKGSGRSTPGYIQNWFYARYDPENFTIGLDVGYRDGFVLNAQLLEVRPSFYYKLFNNLLSVGAMGGMEIGFNSGKSIQDAFYNFWFVEPQVRVNFNSNFYAAVVYRFVSGAYSTETSYKDQKTHWVNIRICYTL